MKSLVIKENLNYGEKMRKKSGKTASIKFLYKDFNPLSADVGYSRHGVFRRAKPSCDAHFQLEIVVFGLISRNCVVLHV